MRTRALLNGSDLTSPDRFPSTYHARSIICMVDEVHHDQGHPQNTQPMPPKGLNPQGGFLPQKFLHKVNPIGNLKDEGRPLRVLLPRLDSVIC